MTKNLESLFKVYQVVLYDYIPRQIVEFRTLCDWFARIERTSKRLEMTAILEELLSELLLEEIPPAIYLSTGELGPKYDMLVLGLQERQVMKILASLTAHPLDEIEEQFKVIGDLGDIIQNLEDKGKQTTLDSFFDNKTESKIWTILEVWNELEKIASVSGKDSENKKTNIAVNLLRDMSPLERKYLVRTLVGKMRLGAKDSTWLDATSNVTGISIEELDTAFAVRSNTGLVIQTALKEGKTGIEELKNPKVGIPIMPMLPQRATTATDIWERMEGQCQIETKYDGFRIQIHYSPQSVNLWSRNEESYNSIFPEVIDGIKEALGDHSAILDGEIVAYNSQTGEMESFQKLTNRRRVYGIKEIQKEVEVKVFVFDILYADNQNLMNKPLKERVDLLRKILPPQNLFEISPSWACSTPEDIDESLLEAKNRKLEGIMVKSIGENSVYEPGKRSFLWMKYKADYTETIGDTLDLVIVGGWKGKGKRAGFYGTLLMAVYDEQEEVYRTICRLGAGLTEQDMEQLTNEMESLKVPTKPKDVISNLVPDIWVKPKIILEVAAAEITESPVHSVPSPTGDFLSLRFPRYTGNRRDDKSVPEGVSTVEEIQELAKTLTIGKSK
ncbi:MAG: ATP-dependent DNA ligase [Methanobacteriota archaeon]|nr:MAG: ATP-dependent DNA ligase [Euryarchaeota archaeon]